MGNFVRVFFPIIANHNILLNKMVGMKVTAHYGSMGGNIYVGSRTESKEIGDRVSQ